MLYDEKELVEAIGLLEALDRLSNIGRGLKELKAAQGKAMDRVKELLKDYVQEAEPRIG